MSINPAFYYASDLFGDAGDLPSEECTAVEGFLQAFVERIPVEHYHCFARTQAEVDDFKARFLGMHKPGPAPAAVNLTFDDTFEEEEITPAPAQETAEGGKTAPVQPILQYDVRELQPIGHLHLPYPGIAHYAWLRRAFQQRDFCLTGMVHGMATQDVMQMLGGLLTAPIQPWDALVCPSSTARKTVQHILTAWAEYLCERMQITKWKPPTLRLPVIPYGVDCRQFDYGEETGTLRYRWREELGIAQEDIVLLFFGALSFHAKAHPMPMYLAAEEVVRYTGKPVHIIHAGWFANDHIATAFQESAAAHCPSVHSIFIDGRRDDVRHSIWTAADIFVSLADTLQETFGSSALQAMAAGLPVIASDWGGLRDLVRHGEDGFLIPTLACPPGYGEAIAWRHASGIDTFDRYLANAAQAVSIDTQRCTASLMELVERPELRWKMAESAAARAREIYDWPVIMKQYQRVWTELAEHRTQATESVPLDPDAAPSHPLMPDPFRAFSPFPNAPAPKRAMVRIRPGADIGRFELLRHAGVNNYGLLLSETDCKNLLALIAAQGACMIKDIPYYQRPGGREILLRTLVWMAKNGLLAIDGHNAGDGPSLTADAPAIYEKAPPIAWGGVMRHFPDPSFQLKNIVLFFLDKPAEHFSCILRRNLVYFGTFFI